MKNFPNVLLALPTVAISLNVAAGSAPKTVWNGVYTKEQAVRGEQTYLRACASCHRDNLQGDEGPPLIGSRFTFQWRDRTLKDLFNQSKHDARRCTGESRR